MFAIYQIVLLMKNLLLLTALLLLVGATACETGPNVGPEQQDADQLAKLESMLFDAAMIANDNDVVYVSSLANGNYEVRIARPEPKLSGRDIGGDGDGPTAKVRCEGNGVRFVKCIRDAIEEYGCQKITGSADDGYVSEDC